jgi:hypothetical protein
VAVFTVDTLIELLPVLIHDPAGHFVRKGSNFLGYRLLKTFQSLGTMLVYLCFQVAPEKKIARGQIWPPDVTTQRVNMPRKDFSQNSERSTRCVGYCTILPKPHIFCSMFIEKVIQFRPEKVPWHCTIPIGGHRYRTSPSSRKYGPHTPN